MRKALFYFLKDNKENKHKINLVKYLQEKICRYAIQENRPSEQIKGMNVLLRDIISLEDEMFENNEK